MRKEYKFAFQAADIFSLTVICEEGQKIASGSRCGDLYLQYTGSFVKAALPFEKEGEVRDVSNCRTHSLGTRLHDPFVLTRHYGLDRERKFFTVSQIRSLVDAYLEGYKIPFMDGGVYNLLYFVGASQKLYVASVCIREGRLEVAAWLTRTEGATWPTGTRVFSFHPKSEDFR
jgi:hypothetical protein